MMSKQFNYKTLSKSFIENLEGINYMIEHKNSLNFSELEMIKYVEEVCKSVTIDNFDRVLIHLHSLHLCYDIPSYIVNRDFDVLRTYYLNKLKENLNEDL